MNSSKLCTLCPLISLHLFSSLIPLYSLVFSSLTFLHRLSSVQMRQQLLQQVKGAILDATQSLYQSPTLQRNCYPVLLDLSLYVDLQLMYLRVILNST